MDGHHRYFVVRIGVGVLIGHQRDGREIVGEPRLLRLSIFLSGLHKVGKTGPQLVHVL